MREPIESIETYFFEAPREDLFLGPLGPGDVMTDRGYLIRQFSGTVYPVADRSVIIKVTTKNGFVGWGETYGLVAPRVIAELTNDLIFGFVRGRDACEPEEIHEFLYGLMRVRGYSGGFWLDALAGLDIALWDIKGKASGSSLSRLIAESPASHVGAYVSGLPGGTLDERVALGRQLADRGFERFKIKLESFIQGDAMVEGVCEEFSAIRSGVGPDAEISVDLHWIDDADLPLRVCEALAGFRPWFVEAPCMPEELDDLKRICASTDLPIAIGEEWRTVHDARARVGSGIAILQPEMGHTGVTEFVRICELAKRLGLQVIPHATVGMGVFLTASLQVSAAAGLEWHEFQHTVMGRNQKFLEGGFNCERGAYTLPTGSGHGVEPSEEGLSRMALMSGSR